MKKAIILARVSTPEQEKTGLSLEDIQLPQMRDYALEKGLVVDSEYVFQETASQKLRKKFDEMVDYVKKSNDIQAIIAFRVDRMTRNYRDAVEMDNLRIEYHKELHFVNDRLMLDENSVGRDIQDWDLKVFLAKQHINRCQEDAHNTLQSKLKSGGTYGRAPYGYRNIGKDEQRQHPDLPRVLKVSFDAGIVKKVFDWYTTGSDSYLSIAKRLHEDYPTQFPVLKTARRKVENIIKNPYYHGEREYKGKIYPHQYETIIPKEVFEIATEKRTGRARVKDKQKKVTKSIYGGLIRCAECGCAFSPSPNRHTRLGREVESDTYYYCTNSKRQHEQKPPGTNDKELTEQFAKLFKSIKIPQKNLDKLTTTLRDSHEGKKAFTIAETNECRTQIDKLQRRIEKAYEDKLDGSITTEQYNKFRENWTKQKEEYEAKLARISKADKEYYITASYLLELASLSYELFLGSEPEQKRQIITLTLQNLTLKDGNLCYDWVKPFDSIFVSAKSHKWGRWLNLVRNFISSNNPSISNFNFVS